MTAVDSDIDSFIQQQKAKLANERNILNNSDRMNSATYRQRWKEQHVPGSSRKQWAQPMKLSPRGLLDTDQIIEQVQKEKEREEYQKMWREQHGGKDPSPRGPPPPRQNYPPPQPRGRPPPAPSHPANDDYRRRWQQQQQGQGQDFPNNAANHQQSAMPAALDTEAIIRQVEQQKHDREESKRVEAVRDNVLAGGGGRMPNRERGNISTRPTGSPASAVDKDAYKRTWQMQNAQRGYQSRPLREQTDEYKSSNIGSNESDAAKLQKIKARNEEYNQFLASKAEQGPQRRGGGGEQGGEYATIPGLRYSTSAQRREQADIRNKEYNDMLRNKAQQGQRNQPPAAPKQGWGTPTYEEMLEKKRAQEQQYRKANDIGFDGGDGNAKENPARAAEPRRGNQQDGQYFASLPLGGPQDEQARRKEEYKRDLQRQMAEAQYARKAERAQGLLINNNNLAAEALGTPRMVYNDLPTPRRRLDRELDAYHSKILDGITKLDNVSPRIGGQQIAGDRRHRGGLSLGPNAGLDTHLTGSKRPGGAGGSVLDLGFGSVLEAPRVSTLDPPAGLQYQPSTYITANAVPNLNSSVDEAYNFYASLNPLDPSLANAVNVNSGPQGGGRGNPGPGGGGGGGGGGGRGVPNLDLSNIGGERSQSRVRFNEIRKPQNVAVRGMDFGTDDDRKQGQREQQSAYREELERQMQERNMKKQKEREERERYDRKLEEEARNYDPFGKGGGGAPMRDQFGNVISADLRQMRSENLNRGPNAQFTPRVPESYSPEAGRGLGGNTTRVGNSYRDDLIGPPPVQTTAEGETSYARGGHGIFGMPKTDAEKTQADRYKIELKRQIEEKKMEELRKKEQQRLEDEREQKILDEQRARMQAEYEQEQAKIKAKEDEARKKNEEMMQAAEEKKMELERKRREADEERERQRREEQDRQDRERREAEQAERGKSPPIPTMAGKQKTEADDEQGDKKKSVSPPVPATRTKASTPDVPPSRQAVQPRSRPQSSDVLNQLANMRAQLQNERRRVQTMLDDQEDEVEIYDPRQVQRPPPGPIVNTRPEIDVFETAMTRNPVAVRRTPADNRHPDSQAMEDFRNLKNKGNSESRKHIRENYPHEPATDSALEHQQAALLRQQEDLLRGGRDARALDDRSASRMRRDMRSSSSQLHSNSAFVDVNSMGHFPDDFEDLPKRNDSARYRRRNRIPSSPRVTSPDFNSRATFGSQTSLNVDRLAKKNEERLRKLRDLQGDDVSLYDPEDVLDRFMTKQAHNRPPSRNTLLDDTWLRAGSKQSKY